MKLIETDFGKILIGEDAKDNWAILSSASQTDLWFHVKNASSAYVILSPTDEISRGTLKECAALTKQHSKLKTTKKCKIVWTEVKHVKKGKSVGQAIITQAREILI
eukprot:c14042_g1_i1.p1 GENE.c14042_g1_i1~~c14042_g1_i1.p1  ORF type:complete len:106 (+),score=39.54 c14042_g1_i1:56-373(+)